MLSLVTVNIEIDINASAQEIEKRKNICFYCAHFSPNRYVNEDIVEAETGDKKTVTVYFFEDCNIDNISLTGFLTLKTSTCPLGKW